jgi:phosphohistidine phosphatase SixA
MRSRSFIALAGTLAIAMLALAGSASAADAKHAWLCRPGLKPNPCLSGLAATVVTSGGKTRVERPKRAKKPAIDCFYVYPTTSAQSTLNANLLVDKELTNVALSQASRFSQACRVFAPVYRQVTLAGILGRFPGADREQASEIAYAGVASAWREYLKRFNHGRGVVLIGHSQGTGMLKRLITAKIDPVRAQRKRLVSAVLLGGNVVVPKGRDVGGDFKHIPACRSARQTGCVVAYSTFNEHPPSGSPFGRPSAILGPVAENGEVLCVNPAALVGRKRVFQPYFTVNESSGLLGGIGAYPSAKTSWVSFPGLYRARCRQADGYSWLHADPITGASDARPRLGPAPTPGWGLHLWDVNIAAGNLVGLVKRESAAYLRRR